MEQLGIGFDWLREQPVLWQASALAALLLVCGLVYTIVRRIFVRVIRRVAANSRFTWDDALVRARVFSRIAQVAPAIVAYYGVELIPDFGDAPTLVVKRVAVCAMIVAAALAATGFLNAANDVYTENPEHRQRPIKGYVQVVSIVVYLVAGLLVVATLMDRSPLIFLSGVGAMTAVLLLVFRDTLLSLVASIQLTGNDMIHVGDWIEMPRYGADGDVIDVALHTVKVQNWDKTITTIPTHKLIDESFKNWRSMSISGGRRIKRAFSIDMGTIRFLDDDEIEEFSKAALLRDYLEEKRHELAEYNAAPGRDPEVGADMRRLTNVGTLRAYIVAYLRAHPKIHQEMTLIVRQLDPTPDGLPIEVYAFSNDTDWTAYEALQSDIFDHILAIAPEFGLLAYQRPSGADLAALAPEDGDAAEEKGWT